MTLVLSERVEIILFISVCLFVCLLVNLLYWPFVLSSNSPKVTYSYNSLMGNLYA